MKKLTLQQHFRFSKAIILTGYIIAFIGAIITIPLNLRTAWIPFIGFCWVMVGLIWQSRFVGCPHCASKLRAAPHLPKYCPKCGKEIEKE